MWFIELLKCIPAAAWSALAAAIVTSIIAFIGVFITNRGNHKRMLAQHDHERFVRKDQILRERAEELYVIVKNFGKAMYVDHFPYISVIKGDCTYEQALHENLENAKARTYDSSRMEMITAIYFPQLSKSITDLVEFNGNIIHIRSIFKKSGKAKDEELLKVYVEKLNQLGKEIEKLEDQVIQAIKNV